LFKHFFPGGGAGGAEFDLGSLVGQRAGGGRGRAGGRTRQRPPEDVEQDVTIPFDTAANGGTIAIRVGGRQIDVKVPAGIEDGKKLRVPASATGSADVLLRVHVAPHPYFKRDGSDVLLDVPVTVAEAVLGTKVEVPTPGGGPSFRAAWAASFTSDAATAACVGAGPGRGISTRSTPAGRSCCDSRNASRNSRLYRFRTTALPTFRDTEQPSRGWPLSFSQAYTISTPSDADFFRA
jgi:hypothetical protein